VRSSQLPKSCATSQNPYSRRRVRGKIRFSGVLMPEAEGKSAGTRAQRATRRASRPVPVAASTIQHSRALSVRLAAGNEVHEHRALHPHALSNIHDAMQRAPMMCSLARSRVRGRSVRERTRYSRYRDPSHLRRLHNGETMLPKRVSRAATV
jgi:hypothetical protein